MLESVCLRVCVCFSKPEGSADEFVGLQPPFPGLLGQSFDGVGDVLNAGAGGVFDDGCDQSAGSGNGDGNIHRGNRLTFA